MQCLKDFADLRPGERMGNIFTVLPGLRRDSGLATAPIAERSPSVGVQSTLQARSQSPRLRLELETQDDQTGFLGQCLEEVDRLPRIGTSTSSTIME